MINAIVAIATLCGVPTFHGVDSREALACQKYYVKCAEVEKITPITNEYEVAKKLAACISKKQRLGGDK